MPTADPGEIRHEQCRFGTFAAEAHEITESGSVPFAMPLCSFTLPGACPPALIRAWGGAIDMGRDCAVCLAYAPLD